MARPAGQVPEDPGVHGPEGEVGPGPHPSLGQQPVQLGGREVRVEDEAGALPHELQVAGRLQRLAVGGRAPVLPHDRPVERTAGASVPHHRRLSLVGDADRRQRLVELADEVGQGGVDRGQDVVGLVLDPARLREVLGELAVGPAGRPAGLVDREGPHAGGAGVDGHDH